MSETNPEALAERALRLLNEGDPREARAVLLEAVQAAPHRADLLHALGFVHLQLAEPELARPLIENAVALAAEQGARPEFREQSATMVQGFLLSLAAACEDLDEPGDARDAYRRVLTADPAQPRARQGLAQLLLSWGELDAGVRELRAYVEEDRDEDAFLEGASALLADIERFVKEDVHPREFLVAHRGSYVQFFDHHAGEQAKHGWIAEAARMRRAPDGHLVPVVPEGARPYAAQRVDLVNPATSQVGEMGDQPMVVALAAYQPLARAAVAFPVRGEPFALRISSQAPWNQLPVQVLFREQGALDALDAVVGDWYTRGFDGAFGTPDGQRLHYISDPQPRRGGRGVAYDVDMGRARVDAIDDLVNRLRVLHEAHPIACVLVGRGYLP